MEGSNIPTIVERKQGGAGLVYKKIEYPKRLQQGKKIYYYCRYHIYNDIVRQNVKNFEHLVVNIELFHS